MLIRFVVQNLLSFGDQKEFNTIPNKRLQTLPHHKYNVEGFDILKLSSIYGANASGKSNLTRGIEIIKGLVCGKRLALSFKDIRFKLNKKQSDKDQILAIEFINDDIPFLYALKLGEKHIIEEELYISGLGKKTDELVYTRKTNNDGITTINFPDSIENDEKVKVLKGVLIEEFVKPSEPILRILAKRENDIFKNSKIAYDWFKNKLRIIGPHSKPTALADTLDRDSEFRSFAENVLCSFHLGITSLTTHKKRMSEVIDEKSSEYADIVKDLDESPETIVEIRANESRNLEFVKEDDQYWVKELQLGHNNTDNEIINFSLDQESDGTVRLLDFIPALFSVIKKNKVFIVDEIERSIHPLLIKDVIKKFSEDEKTKGQLIFTTHESNLLDQEIFRKDEIWFTEKDKTHASDLYSLSDFKEHKTIDIRKGYLSGRYGSIPFLGNLKDLNWHRDDTSKQAVRKK